MKEETKRMDNRYAISNYPDAAAVTKQLDELIKQIGRASCRERV